MPVANCYGRVKPNEEEGGVSVHFLCPISLEIMEDPVTLCTGITYDRANIHKWLNLIGRDTCPVSNQRLISKDLLPNLVLRSLICRWQYSMTSPSPSSPNLSVQNQAFHSLTQRLQYISSPSHLLQALLSLHVLLSAQQNSSQTIRLALATLTCLLRRSEERAVREKTLEVAEMLLKQAMAEGGVKGFLCAEFVPTIVCYTMIGVSGAATMLSLRMLCSVCEEEEVCSREAAKSGVLSKLLFLLQSPQSCSHTRKRVLQLLDLLRGQRTTTFPRSRQS